MYVLVAQHGSAKTAITFGSAIFFKPAPTHCVQREKFSDDNGAAANHFLSLFKRRNYAAAN